MYQKVLSGHRSRRLEQGSQQISDQNIHYLQSYDKLNENRTLAPTKFHEGKKSRLFFLEFW